MPWARLEDNYFTHHKVAELSKDAKLLDLAAIAFSARELRDGELSRSDVRVVAAQVDVDDPFAVADQLVTAGRWFKRDNGYAIHDYLKYNQSREKVLQDREKRAARVAKWREKHPQQTRSRPRSRNRVSDEVTDEVRAPAPGPGPGPGTRNPDPLPDPDSEPGDARATRDGSDAQKERLKRRKTALPGASIALDPPNANGHVRLELGVFNEDLAVRVQQIGAELDDDNIPASITRAQRLQAAAQLEAGTMANAIKDAHRRTLARLDDLSRAPPSSPMAYFLAVLEQTTAERRAR